MQRQDLNGINILVVEDEEALRSILCSTIRSHGAEVAEAINGTIAFKMINESKFDFVVSDVRMPGGDGIALLKAISKLAVRPKVIMITGFSDFPASEATEYGAIAILNKPFGRSQLLDLIKTHATT